MLKFSGIGSAFNLEEGSNSAYFTISNTLYLIDCGETTFHSMMKLVDFKRFDDVVILITHVHNDHIGSLGTLISYLYLIDGIKVTVIHPSKILYGILDDMGISPDFYNQKQESSIIGNSVTVRFLETTHASDMDCYGLEITGNDQTIYYSGDSNTISTYTINKLKEGTYAKVYQDITINPNSGGHLYYGKLLELVPKHVLHKLMAMHLDLKSKEVLKEVGIKTVRRELDA